MERIEEMSSAPRLDRLEKLVREMEQMSPMISPDLVEQLRECLTTLTPSNLSADEKLQVWRLSYTIWNLCVDMANNLQHGQEVDEDHARLRQIASELLFIARDIDIVESSLLKIATFFYRTGVMWHKLKNFELAAVCFEKVTELMLTVQKEQDRNATPRSTEDHEFMFDLFVARSQTAWELSHKALACSLLGRARNLLVFLPQHHVQLAERYFEYGKSLLTKQDDLECQADAIKHFEQAFEISSSAVNDNPEELGNDNVGSLKLKILRYLAAAHLQRENYESVLKCLVVLKSAPEHPSTSYLAVKALAGLDRYGEAEKELFALVRQTAANTEVCMSGIEAVLQDSDRLEAGKRAFLILQSRYPSNKGLPVRMLEYLLRRLPAVDMNTKKRMEVVVDIASNEDVVATVTGVPHGGIPELVLANGNSSNGKEQECTHVLLWNSGSECFHAKQYETCIKLFETSMLYLRRDSDSNLQRAKSLRVLCLCHLALLQYDRANEYVTEAEKIDPNITCAFLKFKIHLQNKNEEAAAEQVEKMLSCPDFEPEYLSLASHEALTCNCTKVAISALTKFLNLPREKRSTGADGGTKEVVVIRNIVNLALQDPQHQMEALKHLKEAQARLVDVGFDTFFGSGDLGPQEANWFASTSWNQGLLAIKNQEYQLAADYFSCASDFYDSLPESEENLRSLQKSLLLATSSLLASKAGDDCIRSASRMLEKCRKVHRALAMSMDPKVIADEEDSSQIHLNLLAFDLKSRSKDYQSQLDILHHCSSLPGFKADYFILMANQAAADKPTGEGIEVASTGYRMALKFILNSTSPDYKLVAMIVRKLITVAGHHCKDGPEVMAVYKNAKEILAGLDPGEYPLEEVQWLVATAWNRAGLPIKFLRFSEAESWMEVALGLADHYPHMANCKLSMIDSLKEVQQSKQVHNANTDKQSGT